jgi:hypothetical protein
MEMGKTQWSGLIVAGANCGLRFQYLGLVPVVIGGASSYEEIENPLACNKKTDMNKAPWSGRF